MTRVTFFRRLLGVLFVAIAPVIYLSEAERGTFACERATGTCVHTVERLTGTLPTRTIPLTDVLGAVSKHSYWDEAPEARQILARARSMKDVGTNEESLWVSKPHSRRGRTSFSSVVILTRQGLVSLLPGYPPGSADVSGFERFLAGEGDRFALVQDDRFSTLRLPLLLLAIGVIVIWFRGPDPPRKAE